MVGKQKQIDNTSSLSSILKKREYNERFLDQFNASCDIHN